MQKNLKQVGIECNRNVLDNDCKGVFNKFIQLRKIREIDLKKIMIWRMSPEVTKYMFTDPKLTMKKQMIWYEKIKNNKAYQYWIILYNATEIGLIAITNITETSCELAWYIGENSYRGRGIGKLLLQNLLEYVFTKLQLTEINSEALEMNIDAIRLYEKCGFQNVREKEFTIIKNNVEHKVIHLSLIKDRWQKTKDSFFYEKINFGSN